MPKKSRAAVNKSSKLNSSNASKALQSDAKITLGGKEYGLKYNLYSFCKLDEATGKNIFDGDIFDTVRPKDMVALLWAGIINDAPEMTIDDVGKMVELKDVMMLPQLIQQGVVDSQPSVSEKKNTSSTRKKKTKKG